MITPYFFIINAKFGKKNKTKPYQNILQYLSNGFFKFFNRALIEITQFVTFSVTFESYLKWVFSSIEKISLSFIVLARNS